MVRLVDLVLFEPDPDAQQSTVLHARVHVQDVPVWVGEPEALDDPHWQDCLPYRCSRERGTRVDDVGHVVDLHHHLGPQVSAVIKQPIDHSPLVLLARVAAPGERTDGDDRKKESEASLHLSGPPCDVFPRVIRGSQRTILI